ncbi:Gfo/Idh/MocA family oxidoreductase, partial [Paraglaciecola sp.]
DFSIVCQSEQTANEVQQEFNVPSFSGGLINHLTFNSQKYQYCIIALPIDILAENCKKVIEHNIPNILVEKPLSLDLEVIENIKKAAEMFKTKVYVAYNRRFFTSVSKLQKMAISDGGIRSLNFEFTEWVDKIDWQNKSKKLIDNWLIANSSHIIDLAFYLAGEPKKLSAYRVIADKCETLPLTPDRYTGAGITHSNVLFSYQANWDGPGRWSVECCSQNYRFLLSPLEKLQIIKRNKVVSEHVEIDDSYDKKFKPGFYRQVDAFLNDKSGLMTLEQQHNRFSVYQEMHQPTRERT